MKNSKSLKLRSIGLLFAFMYFANIASAQDKYFITFYGSNDYVPGHAFVAFGKEDATAGMSISDGVWGLYPNTKMNGLKSAMPGENEVPGVVKNEADSAMQENSLHGIMVEVSKTEYNNALAVVKKWKKEGKYEALKKDCVSFIIEVANQIGSLNVPSRAGLEVLPRFYILKLIENNQ